MNQAIILKGAIGLAATFAAATVTVSAVLPNTSAGTVRSLVSEGNRYLNELDYETAIAQYQLALEIEPNHIEAIQGIIQAARDNGDTGMAEEYIQYYWEIASGDERIYEENKEVLAQMTDSAREFFEDPADYADFLVRLCAGVDQDMLADRAVKANMDAASDLAVRHLYDTALERVTALYEKERNPEYLPLLCKLCEMSADRAWRDNDYKHAIELLERALEYSDDDREILDELKRVVEDYVLECINNQQYEEAEKQIEHFRELGGDDSLGEYRERIEDMKTMDKSFQKIIEELNSAFDKDDIEAIETIMNSPEFKDCAKKVRRVFYSESLLQGDVPNGKGTAVYVIDGTAYVYYGSFTDGKRQGDGLWYFSTDKGHLTKYSLNWVDDMPDGNGKIDSYGTLTSYDKNGEETGRRETKEDITFYCSQGIMDGEYLEHCDVISQDSYSYDITINLVKGHAVALNDGDYPEIIDSWHKYKTKIAAYDVVERYDPMWGEYYETYVWHDYSTNEFYTVDGFGNCISQVSVGTKELALR